MTKMRTAVVGAGKMGSIHAKVYSALDDCELIGVVDTQRDHADKLAGQYDCQSFTDCEPLLGSVDAVTISAPTICHRDLAKTFIENNIAVMIEKPLATSIEQGREIVALAKKHNTVLRSAIRRDAIRLCRP